jgi:ubiquinone/menaquinone biosynthesis C-methylase UbiE
VNARSGAPGLTPQDAALYDAVVVPRYSAMFAQLILDEIAPGTRAQVLDVGCGTGTPAFALLRRLGEGGRVVAIDRDPALLELARRRALAEGSRRIFFKCEAADALRFGDQVFDIVVGNLVLDALDAPAALREMCRVLVPGGRLLVTHALRGTFEEVTDMLREVGLRTDRPAVVQRADELVARQETPERLSAMAQAAGFDDVTVRVEPFRISFRSAHELFGDPLVRLVALPEWRAVAGFEPGAENVLQEVESSLDTYFGGGPLSLSVRAGLLTARRPPRA